MRRAAYIELILVLVFGGLLAVIWTWPLAGQIGDSLPFAEGFVPPGGADTHIWVWDFWWVKEALARGVSPFHSDLIFPPRGANLGLHTHVILYGALAVPLTALFGASAAVGVALLSLFAAAFAATFLLARELGTSRPAAVLAAFGWAFAPYFLMKGLEHMNLMAAPWPPLLCLFLLRWMASGRIGPALGVGAVLGLSALTGPLVFVQTALFGLFVVLFAPGEGSKRRRLLRPLPLCLGGTVGVLLSLPALLAIRRGLLSAARYTERIGQLNMGPEGPGGMPDFVARDFLIRPGLSDFLRLPQLHPLAGGGFEALPGGNEIAALHVSGVLLVLALVALVFQRGQRLGAWVALALFCFVLAWDPSLPFGLGHPSEFYRRLPLMDGLRVSARFLPYALLPLALLAARGADALLEHAGARLGRVALALLALLLVFESWTRSYPMMSIEPPPAIAALALEGPRPGANFVLTLPARLVASESMTWQTQHGRGVVESYLARTDPWRIRALESTAPDLYSIVVPKLSPDGVPLGPQPEALALDLEHLGVGTILVDQTAFSRARFLLDQLEELLDDMPNWEREETLGRHVRWHRL